MVIASKNPLLRLGACVLMAFFALTACSTNQPIGQQMSDAGLTSKIKSKLTADPEVNPFEIDVDTNDGVVTLRGRVDEDSDRTEALKLARDTNGVKEVRDRLVVGSAPRDQAPGTDMSLLTSVKSRLVRASGVSAVNIDVDVESSVVTLSGTLRNQEAKNRALQVVREVRGVREIRDELEIKSSQP